MFASIFPILPVLILAHGWMTIMLTHTLSEDEVFSLPPEAYPA